MFCMKLLIILRGPMGSGKTKVGLYLLEALEDSALLDLDLNANGPIQSIDEALGKKNVESCFTEIHIQLIRNGLRHFKKEIIK
jgi:shikimate kinase